MPTQNIPSNREEIGPLGREAVDRIVRPLLRPEDDGKYIAIDVDTNDYEIDADDYSAVSRLQSRRPGARIWLARAGHATTYRIRRRTGQNV